MGEANFVIYQESNFFSIYKLRFQGRSEQQSKTVFLYSRDVRVDDWLNISIVRRHFS